MKKLVIAGSILMLLLVAAVFAVLWYMPIFTFVDVETGM